MFFEVHRIRSFITVENISTGESMTITPKPRKSRIRLSLFNLKGLDFPYNTFFYGTGKGFIVFRCPKPVYSSAEMKKNKKITIRCKEEVFIYSDDTRESGIRVTFDFDSFYNFI